MKPGLSQSTQLKQELKINPRLYQAMDLLYMPLLDLQQHLKQELLNNPFLDMVEPEEDEEDEEARPGRDAEAEDGAGEGRDQRRDRLGGDPPRRIRRRRTPRRARGARVLRAGHGRHAATSSDHLRDQITLLDLTPRQQFLADEFIGNINEDGYLACRARARSSTGVNEESSSRPPRTPSATSTTCRCTRWPKSRRCCGIIQSLDPPGVGARDLRECLMLQLREAGLEQSVPFRLVRDCFEELIDHRWSEISKRFGISPSDVQKAADEIKKLDPKPGPRVLATPATTTSSPISSSTRSTASITSSSTTPTCRASS